MASTPRNPIHRGLITAGIVAILAVTAGCGFDGGAPNATSTLKQLAQVKILTAAAPGSTLLGQAQDRGSSSSVTGRPSGVTAVFAFPGTVTTTAAYYQSTYPQYRLNEEALATAHRIQLTGQDGWAVIGIDITDGAPKIPPHYNPKLTSAPAGNTTFAVINVVGLPRK